MSETHANPWPRSRLQRLAAEKRLLSYFEYWPGWLFYVPVVLQWIMLGIRYRSMTLPTCADPFIESGGICGESKTSILDQIGFSARHWIARYTSFITASTADTIDVATAEAAMWAAGLNYPLVIKPDIGCNGSGVRNIAGPTALARYLVQFPRNARVILQELIKDEKEAGIFYVRRPGQANGMITSLTLKSSPYVIGDGISKLRELIEADPRAGQIAKLYLPRLADRLHTVPALGERVRLVFVGNHCKGAIFENGNTEITPAMTACIDGIAKSMPGFYFGRFDVRYNSLAELRSGTGFRLIEVNGVGSEPTHIWDKDTRLRDAYLSLFRHYRLAFEIGDTNRARDHAGTKLFELFRLWRRQKNLMANYPMND